MSKVVPMETVVSQPVIGQDEPTSLLPTV